MEVYCQDLGIEDCTYVAVGENTTDVVADMINHLRQVHHLDMPSASEILWAEDMPDNASKQDKQAVVNAAEPGKDEAVKTVIRRLMELLNPTKNTQ